MAELAHAAGVIGGDMALTAQPVAIGHQTLQPNGAAGGHGLGGDAHLCAKAVAEAIGEAGRAVEVDPGAVYRSQEAVGRGGSSGADRVGVARAVAGDVLEGGIQIGHHFHAQDQV